MTKEDINTLSNKASLWSSFSGSVKKNIKNFNEVNSTRGLRYYGPSKMSLFNLIIHSFSIIAVFKYNVLFRSILFILIFQFFSNNQIPYVLTLQILVIFFNIVIFIVSLREDEKSLIQSDKNILNVQEITQ